MAGREGDVAWDREVGGVTPPFFFSQGLYAILVRRKDRRCAPKLAAVREPDRQDCLSSTSRWVPFALGGEGDDAWREGDDA
jgi:hypothetical protein